MKFEDAIVIAQEMRDLFSLFCYRIEIAGSLRREKAEVHDIELVAIPKVVNALNDLFGTPVPIYPLQDFISHGIQEGTWRKIKGGDKFIQLELFCGTTLDLFLVTPPAQWGVIQTIRTGPAEFSHWLVTQRRHGGAMPSNARSIDGCIYQNRKPICMPEEIDLFNFLGLEWIEPRDRQPRWPRPMQQPASMGITP